MTVSTISVIIIVRSKLKNQREMRQRRNDIVPAVYEEVDLQHRQPANIETSDNIAYGHITHKQRSIISSEQKLRC